MAPSGANSLPFLLKSIRQYIIQLDIVNFDETQGDGKLDKMKFREHRGGLADSMETMVELDCSMQVLVDHLNKMVIGPWTFKIEDVRLTFQGKDARINWKESWLVYFEGFGVLGYLDRAPDDTPTTAYGRPPAKLTEGIHVRKNIGNFTKSAMEVAMIAPTTAALLEHLRKLWGRDLIAEDIRIHKRKPDRRLNWAENWAVRVTDHTPTTTLAFIDSLPVDLPHVCIPKLHDKELEITDLVKVSAHSMRAVPEGQSAYQLDLVRSGVMLSAGWEAMFEMSKPVLDELVLVNTHTGQRVLVKLEAITHKFE